MNWDKSVLIFCVVSLSFLISATGQSRPISVGGTIIEIPDPPGFATVTPQMTAVVQARQRLAFPESECLVSYIAESDIVQALRNELPKSGKVLWVQSLKERSNTFMSPSSFLRIKELLKAKMPDASKVSPVQLENINKNLPKQSGVESFLSMSPMSFLPPHEETDRTLAFSQFAKVAALDKAGNVLSIVMVTTNTIVHVKGKVLVLFANVEQSDLEWSRTISKQWADSILAANPPDLQSSIAEPLQSTSGGSDREEVASEWIGGGLTALVLGGLLTALIAWPRHHGSGKSEKGEDIVRRSREGTSGTPYSIRARNK
ncbi:MAG: hypothetical protein M1376_13505 [Planctomycetes bacterium]|nr:hypothetical protein [Planctomycetota bacterium]